MAVLSDRDIKKAITEKRIEISNVSIEEISCASVDLKLGNEFRVFKHNELTHIDVRNPNTDNLTELIKIENNKQFIIHPGELVLGTTKEYIKVPSNMIARLDGRSSLGRLGLVIHSTAGIVNPGFEGQLTLEIHNISHIPISIWPNTKICQITFEKLSSDCDKPYNKRASSKYNKQKGPETSKIFTEKK
jgi:dCTP deaminase